MKDMLRIGNHWFNPAVISHVVLAPKPPLKVSVFETGVLLAHEFTGDDAETVLGSLGYGKDVREAEAKKLADDKKAAEAKAAAQLKHDADEAARAEKAAAKAEAKTEAAEAKKEAATAAA